MGALRRTLRLAVAGAFGLLLVSVLSSLTAANTVPVSKAGDSSRAATPNDLKPAACASITLTGKVSGAGTINASGLAQLVTGSAGVDKIKAGNGNDCILSGAGDDDLNGGPGTDVCIGGAGTNTYVNCETVL